MKKTIAFFVVLVVCLSLYACGDKKELEQVKVELGGGDYFVADEGDFIVGEGGTFIIDGGNTSINSKYSKEDLYGNWVDTVAGSTLNIDSINIKLTLSNYGGEYTSDWFMSSINGNTFSMFGFYDFEIIEESKKIRLVSECGEFIREEDAVEQNQNYALGETVSAEAATITLTSVDFVTNLTAETASRFMAEDRGWTSGGMIAGDGKVFARVSFDYTNMAKQEIDMTDIIKVTVDYNDGYCYSTDDGFAFCLNGDGVYRQFGATGYVLDLAPLESDSFLVCIPVMEIVGKDTASPMKILFEIKSGTGVQTVGFTVR